MLLATNLHVPDGFLSIPLSLVGWLLAALLVALALRKTNIYLSERQVPLMGILAAFVFAAQMINFPIAGGTSGHFLGGALTAILMGPWAATLIMTAVIAIQGLIFQDGGLIAMGWNIINMGILTAFTGYLVYRLSARYTSSNRTALIIGGAVGGWLSVLIGAIATAVELAVSGTSALTVALPPMVGVHVLIGIGEALITAAALVFVHRTRPDLIRGSQIRPTDQSAKWIWVGLSIVLLLTMLSPLASSSPDGLEHVAENTGFSEQAQEPSYSLLEDYSIPIKGDANLLTILAGVIGAAVVFGTAISLGRLRQIEKTKEIDAHTSI